jgi:hypothetical protein
MFLIYGEKYLSLKAVHSCVEKRGKYFADAEEVETEVRKWLREQLNTCCWFRHTGKEMGQAYQCWWRICREVNVLSRFEYNMFYVLYPFVSYLLTLPRTLLISVTYIRVCNRIILNVNETFVMLFCLKYSMPNSVHKSRCSYKY